MTKPFQHVLGLIPKGVLAGLFWYMGTDALLSSGVTEKMLYLIRDPQAISPSEPLNGVRKTRIIIFLIIELLGFGATFAVTQTIAAIGFPVIIMALVPIRIWLVPRLPFTKKELDILDGPVASEFVRASQSELMIDVGICRRINLDQTSNNTCSVCCGSASRYASIPRDRESVYI